MEEDEDFDLDDFELDGASLDFDGFEVEETNNNEQEQENFQNDFSDSELLNSVAPEINSPNKKQHLGSKKSVLKTSLVSITFGLIIIVGALWLLSFIKIGNMQTNNGTNTQTTTVQNNSNNKQNTTNVQTNTNKPTTNTNQVTNNKQQIANNNQQTNVIYVTNDDDWIPYKHTENIEFETTLSSDFTVIDKQYYAKEVNTKKDKMLKCIVIGSISGLQGTYELEIPIVAAQKIKTGSVFKVTYSITEYKNVKIINNIKY